MTEMKSTVEEIRVELDESIGWMILERPEAKNALSSEMWRAIPQLMSALYAKGARTIIFRGSNKCFASGADLQELEKIDSYKTAFQFWNAIKETLDFVYTFDIPTISMIEGPCVGGACLLATACDLRIAEDGASFAIPIAKLGIVLDDETVARLVSLTGPSKAAEMLYTGDTISSTKAYECGLIDDCVPINELENRIVTMANAISANGFASIYESKKSIRRAVFQGEKSGLNPQHESVVVSSYLTSDFKTRVQELSNNSN